MELNNIADEIREAITAFFVPLQSEKIVDYGRFENYMLPFRILLAF